MTIDASGTPNTIEDISWVRTALAVEEPSAWSRGELARLTLIPAFVVLLFAGGVYWIRSDLATESADHGPSSLIQVHLIPRPDPTPIPVSAAYQTATANTSSSRPTTDRALSPLPDDMVAKLPDQSPVESLTPSVSNGSPADVAPNEALAKFQQRLINHIAKFQHYPTAAHHRLQGTVGTFFSFDRKGNVLGVWVKTSSGQTILDEAAVETIKRAQPLPPIPPDLPDRLNVQVQLAFDPS